MTMESNALLKDECQNSSAIGRENGITLDTHEETDYSEEVSHSYQYI
jgi:hypothetical protein